jgi:hypothetical protein
MTANGGEEYVKYKNERFGYVVDIPTSVLLPQGEAANGDGQTFLSKNGKAKAVVYGSLKLKETAHMCNALYGLENPDSPNITYKSSKGGLSVVSGYRGDKVFYTKAISAEDRCLKLNIEYPIESREIYDAVTTRIANSFKG